MTDEDDGKEQNVDAIKLELDAVAEAYLNDPGDIKKAVQDAIEEKLEDLSTEVFASLKTESMVIVRASVRPKGP